METDDRLILQPQPALAKEPAVVPVVIFNLRSVSTLIYLSPQNRIEITTVNKPSENWNTLISDYLEAQGMIFATYNGILLSFFCAYSVCKAVFEYCTS
jgi:hypothetical protein